MKCSFVFPLLDLVRGAHELCRGLCVALGPRARGAWGRGVRVSRRGRRRLSWRASTTPPYAHPARAVAASLHCGPATFIFDNI
jgi:hypothetical protein